MIPLLNIIIGTRGQFVKMAPVMQELDKRHILYRIIHTGQHLVSTREMATVFGVRYADIILTQRNRDITSIRTAAMWFLACLLKGLILKKKKRDSVTGFVMVHGDTMSTLIGCILALFWNNKIMHLESGLTTGTLWIPFPEEIIRRITIRCAHVLFASSDWAQENLKAKKVKGIIIGTGANTVLDSVRFIKSKNGALIHDEDYGVVTLHRNETFYSFTNTKKALESLLEIPKTWKLFFVLHSLTKRRLCAYGLMKDLESQENIVLLGYKRYDEFINLVSQASFVITDGGGLQEETYYLNVPCLVIRKKTERLEGLGSSAMLSNMHVDAIPAFIENLAHLKHSKNFKGIEPAKIVVDYCVSKFPASACLSRKNS